MINSKYVVLDTDMILTDIKFLKLKKIYKMVKTISAQFWLSLNQLGFSEGDVCMSSFFLFI